MQRVAGRPSNAGKLNPGILIPFCWLCIESHSKCCHVQLVRAYKPKWTGMPGMTDVRMRLLNRAQPVHSSCEAPASGVKPLLGIK